MQKTRFLDLEIQLNYPYLYAHAGGCEHVLYIKQVRSRISDDVNTIRCTFKSRPNLLICDLCELNLPVKVTWNDFYAPKSPCFWCLNCYSEFHFDANHESVYLFDSKSLNIKI